MEAWAIDTLKGYGLAGIVIAALVMVVIWQARGRAAQDLELQKLHGQRAAERERLIELLADAQNAQRITAEVTSKRNEIMEELADAMTTQANANDRMGDRVSGQTEMFKERLGDFRHVIDAFGESNRVMTGLVSEVRNLVVQMGVKVDALPGIIRDVSRRHGRDA